MEFVAEINGSFQENDIKEEPEIKEEPRSDGENEMILPDIPDIADVDPLQIDNIKQEEPEHPETASYNTGNIGYEAWCQNRKQELRDKFPTRSRYRISKQLDEEWKTLPDAVKEIWKNLVIPSQPTQSFKPVKPRRQSSRPRKPKEFKDIPENEVKRKSTRQFKRQYLTFTIYPDNLDPQKQLELMKKQEDTLEAQKKKNYKKNKPILRSTGYSLWAKEIGDSLRKQCPLMSFSDISKHVGEMWRQLSNLEKYNFRRRARRINEKIAKESLSTKKEKEKDKVSSDDGVTRVSSKGRVLAKSKKLSNFCAFEDKYKTRFSHRKIKSEQSSVVSNQETEDAEQVEEQDPICNSTTEKRRMKRLKSS